MSTSIKDKVGLGKISSALDPLRQLVRSSQEHRSYSSSGGRSADPAEDYDSGGSVRYPLRQLNVEPWGQAADSHFHSTLSDGSQMLLEAFEEARDSGLYEKGTIEHGNAVDEDKSYESVFLQNEDNSILSNRSYIEPDMRYSKIHTLRSVIEDLGGRHVNGSLFSGAVLLEDADPGKIRQDIELLRRYRDDEDIEEEECLNYTMVVPHGIELDYNPVIASVPDAENQGAAETYEEEIIDFLEQAESEGIGYDYVLIAVHDVNLPLELPMRPSYVKKDGLFEDLSHEKKLEVAEVYREKYRYAVNSLAPKLDERGIVAIGAHPTLVERNSEVMDAWRKEEVKQELNDFIFDQSHAVDEEVPSGEIVGRFDDLELGLGVPEIEDMVEMENLQNFYPGEFAREFYEDLAEEIEESDSIVPETNGKGVERQHPSVFWDMITERAFGSDAHREGEQPSRIQKFDEMDLPGRITSVSEIWAENRVEQDVEEQNVTADEADKVRVEAE